MRLKDIFAGTGFFLLSVLNAQYGAIDSLKLPVDSYTLSNGLQVLLQPDESAKEVSVEFWLRDGIRSDPPGQYGLMHFYEHVLPWGGMDSLDYAHLETYRNDSNAQVKMDYTRFYLKVDPQGMAYALKAAAGRLGAAPAGITEGRVEGERKRVLAEIERNSINPLWSADGAMILFAGTFGAHHPYGHGAYGFKEYNQNFTVEEFRARHKEMALANNTVLFVVGNFNTEEARALIREHFEVLPFREKKYMPIEKPGHRHGKRTLPAPSAQDTMNTLVFSWAIPEYTSRANDALPLVSRILQQRLLATDAVSEKVFSCEVFTDLYQYAGRFVVTFRFPDTSDSSALAHTSNQALERLRKQGVTREEMKDAKQALARKLRAMQDQLGFQGSRTELLGEGLLFAEDPNFYLFRLRNQLQLKPVQVRRVIRRRLKNAPFRMLYTRN